MMNRMVVSLVAGLCLTTGSLSAGAQQGSLMQGNERSVVESPIRVAARTPDSEFSTPLMLSRDALVPMQNAEYVTMFGVPLNDVDTVDLELRRIRVFDPGVELVSGGNEADSLDDLGRESRSILLGGEVAGVAGSAAYLAITPTGTNGFIKVDGHTHVITSGAHREDAQARVYNLTTLPEGTIQWEEFQCNAIDPSTFEALDDIEITSERVEALLAQDPRIAPASSGSTNPRVVARGDDVIEDDCRVVDVALETDAELGAEFAGNGEPRQALLDYLETLVGAVNFIYNRNINLQMNVVYVRDWVGQATDADPWNGGSTIDLLLELQDEWTPDSSPTGRDWQGVHLLSPRFLGGGIAFVGAMCNKDFAHAVSANLDMMFPLDDSGLPVDNAATNWDVIVVTHEWGHNLGAPHTHGLNPVVDGCGLGDCSQAENGTIMSYCQLCPGGYTNIELNFTERILNEGIRPYVQGIAPCNLIRPSEVCEIDEPEPVCLADVNGDGQLTGADFSAWIIAYNAGDLAADLNQDGRLTPADFNAWLIAFNAGCDFGGE